MPMPLLPRSVEWNVAMRPDILTIDFGVRCWSFGLDTIVDVDVLGLDEERHLRTLHARAMLRDRWSGGR